MSTEQVQYVLGSRSPRRLGLLGKIVPPKSIAVLPPRSAEEPGFENIHTWETIEEQMRRIARDKNDDVLAQLGEDANRSVVITADTTIVVEDPLAGSLVLGQPPEDENWKQTVRDWFLNYYAGKTHIAATAVCVTVPGGEMYERIVTTEVTFHANVERWLEWYLETEEPRGKAGGYAIQGAGSIFVSRVAGSLSNVVGLPLRELMEMLEMSDAGK